jgi:NAD(P)-dependent dehydrogenase (short-subunit alcohol dehydrogenase family)
MELRDKVIVVTGGANGIGRALCERFAAEKPKAIVVADLDADGAASVAQRVGGLAVTTNVGNEADIISLVRQTSDAFGPIDLFCSNAGIGGAQGGAEVPNEIWQQIWEVNVMAHIFAARTVLPQMIARGSGYLLNTVSAAGLLTQIGNATYSVTKHAALAFAEWLAITHYESGIRVSCLCPQGVKTDMLMRAAQTREANFLIEGALEPATVAEVVVKGIAEENFLILPHPEVAEYFKRKANDYDRWLRGMRRLQAQVISSPQS